jgi:hypothetical protein
MGIGGSDNILYSSTYSMNFLNAQCSLVLCDTVGLNQALYFINASLRTLQVMFW